MEFFELREDLTTSPRWRPDGEQKDVFREDGNGIRWNKSVIGLQIASRRKPAFDFSKVGLYPLVSTRIADVIEQNAAKNDIERVRASTPEIAGSFEVLHLLWKLDCLDPQKSSLSLGVIMKAVIRPDLVGDHQIFRIGVWIVVTKKMKDALELAGMTGAEFEGIETA